MQSPGTSAHRPANRSRRTLWLLLAVCAAPIVASYLAFNFWRPTSQVNYGDLLEPRALPRANLITLEGEPFKLSDVKGDWVLLTVGAAQCDKACTDRLVYLRQVRLAQGKESDRVERVWLLTDNGIPSPQLVSEHAGLHIIRDPSNQIAAALPAVSAASDHIYVIDPLGNLMMRFPPDPDPRRILKDVSRLLRHSKWK
jgi:cytochrome oxidase Cu insertion factor (SCO1/SenC/PrrC family)